MAGKVNRRKGHRRKKDIEQEGVLKGNPTFSKHRETWADAFLTM
jgi:hypothetical protein